MNQSNFADNVAAFKAAEKELEKWKRDFYDVEAWEPCDYELQETLAAWLVAHGAIVDSWVAHESWSGYGVRYFVPGSVLEDYEVFEEALKELLEELEEEEEE